MFSTRDSVKPYIEQKNVILCRSGIQYYHASEIASFITEGNKPPKEKEWYKEYRPANVVVRAKKLCGNLPVTKEHPLDFVDESNWKELAGGATGKEVEVEALDGEAEGEIGLKSDITFYDKDLYEYYQKHKEVSLGYTCKKHFVDNPEEVGYDLILDEITEVNHLAITRAGRGGSSVAVIDSIIGGLRPMRTGIFAWLASKKQKAVNDSAPSSFGKEVLEAVKNSKGTTEEELAGEMKGVLDSMSVLKDCEAKTKLVEVVKDCFDNKKMALDNEDELKATLDSMWIDIHSDSLGEIAKAFAKLGKKPEEKTEPAVNDSEKTEGEEKDSKDKPKEGEEKDSTDKPKEGEDNKNKDGCNKDSVPFATKDDILAVLDSQLEPMVMKAVKKCLGIKEDTKPSVEGSELDSANKGNACVTRDYTSFLE